MSTNNERAASASKALRYYKLAIKAGPFEPDRQVIQDLMTDLMHLFIECDAAPLAGQSIGDLMRRARARYEEELNEEL